MKSDAQRFTEMTGVCWHEVVARGLENICSCGFKSYLIVSLDEHIEESNPTYSNPKEILERMKQFCGEEKYKKFITFVGTYYIVDSYKEGTKTTYYIKEDLILNPPLLLKKAIEFLEAQ